MILTLIKKFYKKYQIINIANNNVFSTIGQGQDICLLYLPPECCAYVTIVTFSFKKKYKIFYRTESHRYRNVPSPLKHADITRSKTVSR